MKLQLYVEDSRSFEAYELLAKKWLQMSPNRSNVDSVRAIFVPAGDMPESMSRLVENAATDGYHCIAFVLDQETADNRTDLLQRCRESFDQLCGDVVDRRDGGDFRIALIIAKSCLECWLLTDTEAVKRAGPGGKYVNYTPEQPGDTQMLAPKEAEAKITHLWREIARRKGQRRRPRYEKSTAVDIAREMNDFSQSSNRNRSFAYFLRMVSCTRDGCHDRQPEADL